MEAKILLLLLVQSVYGQDGGSTSYSTTYNDAGDEEESGVGMAEVVAIIVCILLVGAFILVCIIIFRNAKKRKVLEAIKKE